MEQPIEYAIFEPKGALIAHCGFRFDTLAALRNDLPSSAIVPADEVPANWQQMSVRDGQLVPASAAELAAREQAENERIQQQLGLTERAVPGEFWLDYDGVTKRQVYQKTFIGTTPATVGGYVLLLSNIADFEIVKASVRIQASAPSVKPDYSGNSAWAYAIRIRDYEVNVQKSLVLESIGSGTVGKPYCVIVKYTKL